MLAEPKSARVIKHAMLSAFLATPLICLQVSQAWAQGDLNIQSPSNFVSGEGLSPSYFLPPSTLPLAHPPVESLPTTPTPALVGSGLQPMPPEPVAQVPVPLNFLESTPDSVTHSPPIANPPIADSVDLDLRSAKPHVATSGYSQGGNRPLVTPSRWFFGPNGLILNLKDQHDRVFTSSSLDPSVGLLGSDHVRMPSTGGYELGIGRYFGCGKYALSGTYWGLSPVESIATATTANSGPLASNLPFNVPSVAVPGVTEGLFVGTSALSDLFNASTEHRLERHRDFNNVELNVYWFALGGAARQPFAPDCNESQCWSLSDHPTSSYAPWFQTPSRLRLSLFSGVRWFQFQDELRYSALDAYYKNGVRNDLWGIQTGATTHFLLTPRWSLWNNISAGVYNNRSAFDTTAGNATSLASIVTSGGANGTLYNYNASGNSTAFLGETTTGLAWHFARGWSANLGYRVLGASGIASSESQIPNDFRSPSQASSVHATDSLILHGVTIGAAYNF